MATRDVTLRTACPYSKGMLSIAPLGETFACVGLNWTAALVRETRRAILLAKAMARGGGAKAMMVIGREKEQSSGTESSRKCIPRTGWCECPAKSTTTLLFVQAPPPSSSISSLHSPLISRAPIPRIAAPVLATSRASPVYACVRLQFQPANTLPELLQPFSPTPWVHFYAHPTERRNRPSSSGL